MSAPLLLIPFAGVIGLCLGSFAVTAALRLARAEQAVLGRSHCDSCGVSLSFVQTVPVAAFVRLGGACSNCGARIDRLHLAGELAGALIAMSAIVIAPPLLAGATATVGLLLLTAAVVDLKTRRLPDMLSAGIGLAGLMASATRSMTAVLVGLTGAIAAFLLLEGLRRGFLALTGRAGLGFGDVKLVAALALWLGAATPFAVGGAALIALGVAALAPGGDQRRPFGPYVAIAAFVAGLVQEAHPWLTSV